MKKNTIKKLEVQISKVIPLLEEKYEETKESKLNLYLTRYKKASSIIKNKALAEIKTDDFMSLLGCARGYLENTSNWDQRFLHEMGNAEEMIKQLT